MSKRNTELHYFSFSSDVLIKSCPLPKEMIHSVNAKMNTMTIEANISMSLSEYLKKTKKHMEYRDMEKMIEMIGKQLQHMEMMDKGIPSFNLDDISVFYTHNDAKHRRRDRDNMSKSDDDDTANDTEDTDDDTDDASSYTSIHFALTNDDKVCSFDDELQQLKITAPYKPEYTTAITSTSHKYANKAFISPEFDTFISKKTLPYLIHFKSGYYSFGLLCVHCFVSKTVANTIMTTPQMKEGEISAALSSIINTKIYWFLLRLLHETPSMRRYICV